jgi:lysophospholipase L1-like esterase
MAQQPDFSGGEGYEMYNFGGGSGTVFDLFTSGLGANGVIQSGTSYLPTNSGYYWRSQPTVIGLVTSPSAPPELYLDGIGYPGSSGLAAETLTGGTILGGINSVAGYYPYTAYTNFLGIEIFASTLTQSQVQTVSSAMLPRTFPTVSLIADGDSIMRGQCAVYGHAAVRYAEPSLIGPLDITNIAEGGADIDYSINNSATPTPATSRYARLYQAGYAKNILFIDIGTNDIHGDLRTGAAVWTDMQTVLTNAKSLGYKTVVGTVMHEIGETAAVSNEIVNYNNFLYNSCPSWNTTAPACGGPLIDAIADYAGNPSLQPGYFYPAYSCDGIHPNDSGYAIMGGVAAPAINTVIQ